MVMDKSGSFSKHGNRKNDNAGTPKHASETADAIPGDSDENDNLVEDPSRESTNHASLPQVLDEVDRFLEGLTNAGAEECDPDSNPPEAPNCVEILLTMVEKMIADYSDGKGSIKFGKDPENDSSFLEALSRVSKLSNVLQPFSSLDLPLNKASTVLQKAMSFLDEEFRTLLEDPKPEKSNTTTKQSSFKNQDCNPDRCVLVTDQNHQQQDQFDQADQEDQIFPALSPQTVSKLTAIAKAMISAGYGAECSMAYGVSRRSAFRSALDQLGYDSISIDDAQRMPWESLEGGIAKWIPVVKSCSSVLFPGEKSLCDAVFSDVDPSISQSLFSNLSRAVVIRLLNFAEAVVLTKRSAEKLFKFLDMYETLRDLEKWIGTDDSYPPEIAKEMAAETAAAKARLGEAAASIFCDLENSIKSDTGRTPVPSGAVHPLTRYVMNYLKYACEYKDTLEQVFQQYLKDSSDNENDNGDYDNHNEDHGSATTTSKTSPFSKQLESVMVLLDANLESKSKLYRDQSLSYIFLMNNGRYIVQKIKGSAEIHELMGDTLCRKRSSDLRQYHKNYQRETWGKILQCLGHEGLQVNGKVSKPVLKERFKCFNAMFEEIHKTQSAWVVSDEQLQSELRVSISAVMIPAYRSFLGRFKQYLDSGRQTEKYIKYQPEDIETLIDELFDGNPASMVRRRN